MKKPTEAELEILVILWEKGPSSVRDVHNILAESKDVYYTTTLKTMQVMAAKGLVDRDTSQRSHIYSAAVARDAVEKRLLNGLISSVFKGSTADLIISAIGNSKPSPEELKHIKSLIDKMDEDDAGMD